jgi:hypothetical protein
VRFAQDPPPPANDNAAPRPVPIVRTPRARANATYAYADGVILPLRFARRMPGWAVSDGQDSRMSRHVIPRRR